MKAITTTALGLLLSLSRVAIGAPAESAAQLVSDATPASVEAIVDSDAKIEAVAAKPDQFSRCQAAVRCPLSRSLLDVDAE
jgi:hypothetical protein